MHRYLLIMLNISCSLFFLTAQPEMIHIGTGEFVMGCTDEFKPDCDGDEFPIHAVKLSAFYIGKYEVTQAEWASIMGDNPSMHDQCGDNCPVENIDWYSMLIYCNELTQDNPDLGSGQIVYFKDANFEFPWTLADYGGDGNTSSAEVYVAPFKKGFRLPYEAEWEYAARGGGQNSGFKYAGSDVIDEVAWYNDNADDSTHPVGEKVANALSLFDMSGNVWEKVFDRHADTYGEGHVCDPSGPSEGTDRVNRGGAYNYAFNDSMASSRSYNKSSRSSSNIGFRIARSE
jgi:formylglycine-generating enzyme required for sulfatase activity